MMSFCPYCKEIVGNGVTECPSCGMSWEASEQLQTPPAPRIVNEQPLPAQQPAYQQPPPQPAYQQPPAQPAYQQPPQQPQYQQPPPQPTYQQPPPQPQYQQPPPQQYQQPPPQPQYRQAPPPQYQQPYQQPYAPPRPRKKVGVGSMILAMMGGIMAMACAIMVFYTSVNGVTNFSNMYDNLPDDYIYAWLIPLSGLLAVLFSAIGFGMQNKAMGVLTGVFGILLLILPIVWAFHMASDMDASIADVFYSSESMLGYSYTLIFIGGILAMMGGLFAIAGGFGMAKRIGRVRRPAQQQYNR